MLDESSRRTRPKRSGESGRGNLNLKSQLKVCLDLTFKNSRAHRIKRDRRNGWTTNSISELGKLV